MIDRILTWVDALPPEAAVAALATLPIGELRAALPIGIVVYGMHPLAAFAWSYLGNLLPILIVYAVLPPAVRQAEKRSPLLRRLFEKYFHHLERKYRERYVRYGTAILVIFVAIPVVGSGAWTASVLAILFRIEKRYAIPAILLGMAGAGIIVMLLTVGVINGFS